MMGLMIFLANIKDGIKYTLMKLQQQLQCNSESTTWWQDYAAVNVPNSDLNTCSFELQILGKFKTGL